MKERNERNDQRSEGARTRTRIAERCAARCSTVRCDSRVGEGGGGVGEGASTLGREYRGYVRRVRCIGCGCMVYMSEPDLRGVDFDG